MATTLQNVIDRIRQDYLNRTTDLEVETVRSVQAAIRHYERNRYPWTENGSASLHTTTATLTLSVPDDFLILDGIEIEYGGQRLDLITATYAAIRQMNAVTTNGVPTHFALRGNSFHFFPTPDSAYTINCFYVQQLPKLTATILSATNDWLSAAEDVIVFHAAKLIWANVLRNSEEAQKMYALERTAVSELDEYIAQRETTSITPTKF